MPHLSYVCDYEYLISKMDQNAYNRVSKLLEKGNVTLHNVKRGESIDALKIVEEDNPTMIIQEHIQPGFPPMVHNLHKVKCKTATILGDLHSNIDLWKQISPWSMVLLYYDAGLELKKVFPKKNFRVLPHHISFEVYKDYGLPKEFDILLYGNTNSKFYPFRKRLHSLLKEHFNCHTCEYPNVRGKDLAMLLNRSWLSVTTKSTEDYLVAKYIEIPACNCLPIGNIATTEKKVFKDVVLELTEDMSDEEIVNKVRACLSDKEALQRKILKNKEAIKDFSVDRWVEKIWEIVNGA